MASKPYTGLEAEVNLSLVGRQGGDTFHQGGFPPCPLLLNHAIVNTANQLTHSKMNDLIEALQILRKYGNPDKPTYCGHDVLSVSPEIDPDDVSDEDRKKLDELGFFVSTADGVKVFRSFWFGSC